MDQPVYLRRLLRQKVLLIIGAVVAIIAGLLAGFTIQNGEIVPRADKVYTASGTVLLTSPNPQYFQVEVPGVTQALPAAGDPAAAQELIVQESTPINLASNAIVLAYLASSDQITADVESVVGELSDGEAIAAVSRTTQPTGDETFPGRLTLPLLDIAATALSPDRAEELASAATTAFETMVTTSQDELGVAEDIRLNLDVLNVPVADEGEGSNPAIPVVVVAVGVFLLFVAAALIIEAVRDRRRTKNGEPDDSDDDTDSADGDDAVASAPADADEFTVADERELAPVGASAPLDESAPARSARRRARAPRVDSSVNAFAGAPADASHND